MATRECDCKEFQDSGHTDECNEYYKPKSACPICGGVYPLHEWNCTLNNASKGSDV